MLLAIVGIKVVFVSPHKLHCTQLVRLCELDSPQKEEKVKQLEISFSYLHIVFRYLSSSFACVHCSGICHCTHIVQVHSSLIIKKNKKVQQPLVFGDGNVGFLRIQFSVASIGQ